MCFNGEGLFFLHVHCSSRETRSQEQKCLQLKANYFVSVVRTGEGSAFLQEFFPSNKLYFKQFFSPEHVRRSCILAYNK